MNNNTNEMNESKIKVYAKVDENGNITAVDSSIFLADPTGWIEIDEGLGDRYALAQGNYFDPPMRDDYGNLLYKWDGSAAVRRSADELQPGIVNALKADKLVENSTRCEQIITTEFKSSVKGGGLQPYRMSEHDQINLSGMQGMINTLLVTGTAPEDMPLFSWQNANQTKCVDDWHYSQILELIGEFGAWKTLVLKRQDEIKGCILEAETAEEVNAVVIDYSDLLDFGEKL